MSVFAWVRCQQQPTSTPPWFPKGAWCWLSISALVCTSLHRLISPLAEEVCERANGPDSEANADTDKPIHGYLLCPMTCRMGTVLATANIPVLSLERARRVVCQIIIRTMMSCATPTATAVQGLRMTLRIFSCMRSFPNSPNRGYGGLLHNNNQPNPHKNLRYLSRFIDPLELSKVVVHCLAVVYWMV